jgi:O-antigen/teichoic acid export membrane protein
VLSNGISSSLTAVYQGMERVFHSAMGTMIEKALVAVIALILLGSGFGIVAIAAAFVAGSIVGTIWKAAFLRTVTPIRASVDLVTVRKLVMGALPFFLYWALGAVYYRIDVVLLSKLTDATAVGWYGAAYRLFDTLVFLPGIVSTVVMFPILARLAAASHPDLRVALAKGLEVMVVLGAPICTGLFVLAEPIIRFIYGKPEFLPAVPALQLLAVGLFFLYVNSVLGVALVSLNQERKMTVIAAVATVVNLGLNWLFIPHFQHLAAASVTTATEMLIFGYLCWCVPRGMLSWTTAIVLGKAGVAVIAMTLVLEALAGQSVLLLVPVGAVAYCVSGFLWQIVPPEDIRRFRQVFGARRRTRTAPATT